MNDPFSILGVDENADDSEIKRREYALAAIPEYWLIDPTSQTVTVLVLPTDADRYCVQGVYAAGSKAASASLPGFAVDVGALFTQDL